MMDLEGRLATAYATHRQVLLSVAYRMLGSFGDAEDVVQEAFLRYRGALAEGAAPDSERAYLLTITTRLAIDELRSARHRREAYVGPWLPEPAVEGLTDLADDAVLADSLSTAFLVLLERLGPEQRAVLLLRDVFALSFREVAGILGKSEEACRQIAVRARRHVHQDRPRFTSDPGTAKRLGDRFFAAAREGDLQALVALLAEEAEFVGDGGDSRRGVTRVLVGAEPVALVVRGIFRQIRERHGTVEPVWVGRQPGVLLLDADGDLLGVWSLALAGDRVRAVHGVVNPDKLGHLGLPLTSLLGPRPRRT
jgi:RNA polymerase sigma factor (sigma-70 family)